MDSLPKSKHTPPPWVVANSGTCVVRDSKEFYMVASVFPHDPCDTCSDGPKSIEMRANARLIAAAPDLLAGAREALTALEKMYESTEIPESWVRPLRAAIAKAEGRP